MYDNEVRDVLENFREGLFARDRVHLGRAGHEAVAGAVLKAIEASGP